MQPGYKIRFGHAIICLSKRCTKVFTIEKIDYQNDFGARRFLKNKILVIVQGDSSIVIEELIKKISSPEVFLDRPASRGVSEFGEKSLPVRVELNLITSFIYLQKYLLFKEDEAGFNGTNSFPTYQDIAKWCAEIKLEVPKVELDTLVIYKLT